MIKPLSNIIFFQLIIYVLLGCSSEQNLIRLSEDQFIELFYNLEIKRFQESPVSKISLPNSKEIQEKQYFIQTYQLWNSEKYQTILQLYHEKRNELYLDQDNWKNILLKAHNLDLSYTKSLNEKATNQFLSFLDKQYPSITKIIRQQHEEIDLQVNENELDHPKNLNWSIDTIKISQDSESSNKHDSKNQIFIDSLYMNSTSLSQTQVKFIEWAKDSSSNISELKEYLNFAWMQFFFKLNNLKYIN